jgi:hypothetical protein
MHLSQHVRRAVEDSLFRLRASFRLPGRDEWRGSR